ncbi:alpha-1,2-fucosyltransferase [Patescibacteria group bacterium]
MKFKEMKPVIIIKIIGGLGNQMFQYALGRNLSKKTDAILKLDITDFKGYKFHEYSLNHFNIKEDYATKDEIKYFKKYARKYGKIWYPYNLFIANEKRYIQEKQYTFNPEILKIKNSCYIDGYWQSEKYFKDIEHVIRKEFVIKKPLGDYGQKIAGAIKSKKNPVCLHIRRGDFANSPEQAKHHGVSPLDYYYSAINTLTKTIPDAHFFVFSDSIDWVKDNLKLSYPITYVGQGSEKNYEDITLISYCKHHILSNSTFGWWGAWLGQTKDQIVIAPKKWFNKNMNLSDLMPEWWIKI